MKLGLHLERSRQAPAWAAALRPWWTVLAVGSSVAICIVILVASVLTAGGQINSEGVQQVSAFSMMRPCICTTEFMPVCSGAPPVTRPNSCEAKCHGEEIHHDGECEEKLSPECMACTEEFAPVCDDRKRTYLNSCVAECSKVTIKRKGICSTTMIVRPQLPSKSQITGL
mmetsp:Transcript_43410/g.130208  ORF Transcript_43410/g.130208 Transcript_43410/m.130208 type:complete len:170 (-) Transcript_43410:208-717(-)